MGATRTAGGRRVGPRGRRRAFSLIELVIVVVIIGTISAIAIPRLNRGSASAGESALAANLSALRSAIDYYRADHNAFPTCDALPGNQTTIMLQLTQCTDESGNVSAIRSAAHRFGPYLQSIPPLTVSFRKGYAKIATADGSRVGWLYDPATGEISANTDGLKDTSGVKQFKDY